MPKVLIPLAQGCEELEAITLIDILRRADVDVVTAGLDSKPVKSSHGVTILPDTTLAEAMNDSYDMVILPGGLPGADHLAADNRLNALLKEMVESDRFVGAICAAPQVLAKAGLLEGKTITSYPGFVVSDDFPNVINTGSALEKDGKIITSRGPGTAMDFALELVRLLQGEAKRKVIEKALVRP